MKKNSFLLPIIISSSLLVLFIVIIAIKSGSFLLNSKAVRNTVDVEPIALDGSTPNDAETFVANWHWLNEDEQATEKGIACLWGGPKPTDGNYWSGKLPQDCENDYNSTAEVKLTDLDSDDRVVATFSIHAVNGEYDTTKINPNTGEFYKARRVRILSYSTDTTIIANNPPNLPPFPENGVDDGSQFHYSPPPDESYYYVDVTYPEFPNHDYQDHNAEGGRVDVTVVGKADVNGNFRLSAWSPGGLNDIAYRGGYEGDSVVVTPITITITHEQPPCTENNGFYQFGTPAPSRIDYRSTYFIMSNFDITEISRDGNHVETKVQGTILPVGQKNIDRLVVGLIDENNTVTETHEVNIGSPGNLIQIYKTIDFQNFTSNKKVVVYGISDSGDLDYCNLGYTNDTLQTNYPQCFSVDTRPISGTIISSGETISGAGKAKNADRIRIMRNGTIQVPSLESGIISDGDRSNFTFKFNAIPEYRYQVQVSNDGQIWSNQGCEMAWNSNLTPTPTPTTAMSMCLSVEPFENTPPFNSSLAENTLVSVKVNALNPKGYRILDNNGNIMSLKSSSSDNDNILRFYANPSMPYHANILGENGHWNTRQECAFQWQPEEISQYCGVAFALDPRMKVLGCQEEYDAPGYQSIDWGSDYQLVTSESYVWKEALKVGDDILNVMLKDYGNQTYIEGLELNGEILPETTNIQNPNFWLYVRPKYFGSAHNNTTYKALEVQVYFPENATGLFVDWRNEGEINAASVDFVNTDDNYGWIGSPKQITPPVKELATKNNSIIDSIFEFIRNIFHRR